MGRQPFLHDLLVAVAAPTQAWSARDGQIRPEGAHGVYDGDLRVVSRAELTVSGEPPEMVAGGPVAAGTVEVVGVVRAVDGPGADPTVRLVRRRTVAPGTLTESVTVCAATPTPVRVRLELALACDLAPMVAVKAGHRGKPLPARTDRGGVTWVDGGTTVRVDAPGARVTTDADPLAPTLGWDLTVGPDVPVSVEWHLAVERLADVVLPALGPAPWAVPVIDCDDRRLPRLVARSLDDLAALRMRAAFAPDDEFVAAGAPWFFTLFGRDSLWAARMLLPLGTHVAGATLRTLAARQGRTHDADSAEQPGKILHELRSGSLDVGGGTVLPPTYYGTVDATPLWVCLLHDAWRWGMPADEVAALLPAMEGALAWMDRDGDADGDGFLEYLDTSGHGLANQGWKDSGDSVQWRDGSLARGPIALSEVQAYAHEAALGGATLLEAFGRPGAERWRDWAARLARRFRAQFWVDDGSGPYPAIALDADKRPVDSVTSNIGHLLGTGLLDPAEEALVAARLGSADLDSGYGLRTMARGSAGYWPLRYHGGAVWAHDTAIAVAGLARAGRLDVAGSLAEGLLTAAAEVDFRLPELYSGDARGEVPVLVPYPAACRPQAWAAASAVVLATAFLGLTPDAPSGVLTVAPTGPTPFGALRLAGLRVAGRALTVGVDAQGRVSEVTAEAGLLVRTV